MRTYSFTLEIWLDLQQIKMRFRNEEFEIFKGCIHLERSKDINPLVDSQLCRI